MTPLLFLSRKAGRMCIRLFYLFLRNYEAEANTARKSPQTLMRQHVARLSYRLLIFCGFIVLHVVQQIYNKSK